MCLWYVQKCSYCKAISAIPTNPPQFCDVPSFERKTLDPTCLTDQQKYLFLEWDERCNSFCTFHRCGLVIRMRTCGRLFAVRQQCEYPNKTDSEN